MIFIGVAASVTARARRVRAAKTSPFLSAIVTHKPSGAVAVRTIRIARVTPVQYRRYSRRSAEAVYAFHFPASEAVPNSCAGFAVSRKFATSSVRVASACSSHERPAALKIAVADSVEVAAADVIGRIEGPTTGRAFAGFAIASRAFEAKL